MQPTENRKNAMAAPAEASVSCGNAQIDEAFRISVNMVDELRARFYAAGGARGWLPVSGGKRGPLVHEPDRRDSAHMVQMAAYLWGHEPDLAAALEQAAYLTYIDEKSGAMVWPGDNGGTAGVLAGMFMRCTADTYRYFAPGSRMREALRRAALFTRWIGETFDSEDSGLIDNRNSWFPCFWGQHLGEPSHHPTNYDPKSKTVCASMAQAVWLRRMEEAARAAQAPEAELFARRYRRVVQALEEQAWSERAGYYRIQHDRLADRWFFSLNGLSEASRETDIVPYYAAGCGVPPERQRNVARWIDQALMRDRCFPMPTFYPTYAWYSPEHPNYIDCGAERSVLGGSWDTPFFHCVELLREVGLVDTVELAIRRRAEAIARDGDCLEWYYRDGTTDNAVGFHRDRYLVCGTALIAAVIEGLFGVTPAAQAFGAVRIAPALPLYRRHRHTGHPSPYAERDNNLRCTLPGGRRLELTVRYSEGDETLRVRVNRLGLPAQFRLPVDLATRVRSVTWGGAPADYRLESSMGQAFVCLDHELDGGELAIHMDPHPQKGAGTTPITFIKGPPTRNVTSVDLAPLEGGGKND